MRAAGFCGFGGFVFGNFEFVVVSIVFREVWIYDRGDVSVRFCFFCFGSGYSGLEYRFGNRFFGFWFSLVRFYCGVFCVLIFLCKVGFVIVFIFRLSTK